jgi:SHS2 domain-containing protein
MPYEFLEDVATADIAFRAWGSSVEETFSAAADAVMNVMVEDLEAIQPREERQLTVDSEALDLLLFDLLQELVYYKDSELLLLRVPQVRIAKDHDGYRLEATARGETLDANRHQMRVDVKAVTLHRFSLQQNECGWGVGNPRHLAGAHAWPASACTGAGCCHVWTRHRYRGTALVEDRRRPARIYRNEVLVAPPGGNASSGDVGRAALLLRLKRRGPPG